MGFLHTKAGKWADDKAGRNTADPIVVRRFKHALGGKFHEIPKYHRAEFRASALPFCPILHVDHTIFNMAQDESPRETEHSVSWHGAFYTTIGTDTHTHWQKVMARAARDKGGPKVKPYGGWECTHCRKKLPPQFMPEPHDCGPYTFQQFADERQRYAKDPIPANKLQREYRELGPDPEWDYIELGIQDRSFSGHVDWVEYFVDEDIWAVYDLKTAGLGAIQNPDKQLPILKNIFQIEQYAHLLPKHFKKITKIDEYCLLYQARETANKWYPYRVEWTRERQDRARIRCERWQKGFTQAEGFLQKFRHDKETARDLDSVVDARPCLTEKSYIREMAPHFMYEGKCRHFDACTTCEGQKLANRIYSTIMSSIS